jgi:hypothetical protein
MSWNCWCKKRANLQLTVNEADCLIDSIYFSNKKWQHPQHFPYFLEDGDGFHS